jgi:hypothetical protein
MLNIKNPKAKALGFLISAQCLTKYHLDLSFRVKNKKSPEGHFLFFLLVDAVGLRNWIELLGFVLLAGVLLVLVVEAGVVGMAFPNAIFVAH